MSVISLLLKTLVLVFLINSANAKSYKCEAITKTTDNPTGSTRKPLCEPEISCPSYYNWDYATCSCLPETTTISPTPCEPEAPCFYWDYGTCTCYPENTPGPSLCEPETPCMNWDYATCTCPPEPTTETPISTPKGTACTEIPCRNRNVWLQEICDCVCPPIACTDPGTMHGDDCNCVPAPTTDDFGY